MNLLTFVVALMLVPAAAPEPARPMMRDQAAQTPQTIRSPSGTAATSYTIGPEDLLTITVFGEQELTNKYRVDTDGMVTFPLIGRVAAAGLTIREFQDRLTSELAAGYIKNPQVRVEVDQYKSQSLFVVGEVRSPGKITMSGSMTLLEALALAGSPTSTASSEVIVVHPRKATTAAAAVMPGDDEDAETAHVNLRDLQLGKAGQDVVLRDGDTIFVPKAQTFYITGQVKNPGSYVLDPGMTVLQAISVAGGLTDRGSNRGIKVERIVKGKRIVVDVSLIDIVQPNDTIQIRARFF